MLISSALQRRSMLRGEESAEPPKPVINSLLTLSAKGTDSKNELLRSRTLTAARKIGTTGEIKCMPKESVEGAPQHEIETHFMCIEGILANPLLPSSTTAHDVLPSLPASPSLLVNTGPNPRISPSTTTCTLSILKIVLIISLGSCRL